MADDSRNPLNIPFLRLLGVVAVAGVLAWLFPILVEPMLTARNVKTQRKLTPDPDEVDAFMADALPRVGATDVRARSETDDEIHAIIRLPQGTNAWSAGRRLKEMADESDIELYTARVDGLDVEVRAYAGPRLRQRLLLVPDLPPAPTLSLGPRSLKRPLFSLIVVGLGTADASQVIDSPVPLTLAVHPYEPFSLRIAADAAHNWHEVLVHVTTAEDTAVLRRALPFASGLWVDTAPPATTSPLDVVAHPASTRVPRKKSSRRDVAAQMTERRAAMDTLRRARHLAVRNGSAAMAIEADDPQLSEVLAWTYRAHKDGYRVVLASEVARADQTRGVSTADMDR